MLRTRIQGGRQYGNLVGLKDMRPRYVALAFTVICVATVLLCWQREACGGTSTEVALYTAHQAITKHLIMSDGTSMDTFTTDERARDRQGRTYLKTERVFRNGDQRIESFSFLVEDPVKLRTLTWDSNGKTVVLGEWPYWSGRKGCWTDEYGQRLVSSASNEDWHKVPASPGDGKLETIGSIVDPSGKRVKARFVSENLGHKEIHRLLAFGIRWTTTPLEVDETHNIPETTIELWKSSEFDLKVIEVESGPHFGLKRLELTDLQRGDPDPSLFEPPKGYTVETVEYHQVPCGRK